MSLNLVVVLVRVVSVLVVHRAHSMFEVITLDDCGPHRTIGRIKNNYFFKFLIIECMLLTKINTIDVIF